MVKVALMKIVVKTNRTIRIEEIEDIFVQSGRLDLFKHSDTH